MWKFLAPLCIALMFVSAEKANNRISGIPFLASYMKVPHHQPKYRGILRKALVSVGVPLKGIQVLSLYKKNEGYKVTYKVTYENDKGETCFMKWAVLAILNSSDPELPSCTQPDEEFARRAKSYKSKKKSKQNNSRKKKKKTKQRRRPKKSKKKSGQNRSKKNKKG